MAFAAALRGRLMFFFCVDRVSFYFIELLYTVYSVVRVDLFVLQTFDVFINVGVVLSSIQLY